MSACAATGNLEQYPSRRIDRPFTLPKGIAAWEPAWHFENLKYNGGSVRDTSSNVTVWTSSVSDSLNITWFPLPLLVSYQVDRTERAVSGIDIGVDKLGYSEDDKWTLGAVISGSHRYKFNTWLALATRLSFEDVIRTKGHRSDSWGVDAATGPLLQITDDVAVLPRVHYAIERNYPSVFDRPDTLENRTFKLVPLSVSVSWNLGRQWELAITYKYKSIGYPDGTREENMNIGMIHYW